MGKATFLEANMLRELDTLCHADGITQVEFNKIGRWVQAAGDDYNSLNLSDGAFKKMREMHNKYFGNKG